MDARSGSYTLLSFVRNLFFMKWALGLGA